MDLAEQDRRVVVTGIGMLTGNGQNRDQVFAACAEGVSGLRPCTLFDTAGLRTAYAGQIQDPAIPYLTERPEEKDRLLHIADRALDEAMADAGLTCGDVSALGIRAAVSFATCLGAIGRVIGHVEGKKAQGEADPAWLAPSPVFISHIKRRCGAGGPCYTTMSACAAGTTAAGIGFDLIRENKADVVLAGGADPLMAFTCYGFHSLKSLSESRCRPFDENRDGINLGEGSAFLVLEELRHAKARGRRIYGEVLGYGLNNDAYHITSPDPEGFGACASMRAAAGDLPLDRIDYINAHGTGTKVNDEMEAKAIGRLFGDRGHDLSVSSTKSMVGHCLAAAGAIEMAVSLLTIYHGIVTPTIRRENPMEACAPFDYPGEKERKPVRYALSNSFAFAGNTASVLLGRYEDGGN